jgi:phage gp46-like protein
MDIYYAYDKEKRFSDMKIIGGDFLLCDAPRYNPATGKSVFVSSLQVAVELALFTDLRASTEEIRQFQIGQSDRMSKRGYWANTFKNVPQGSKLWLLTRAKRTQATLTRAITFSKEALQHLIDDGIVANITPSASFSGEALILIIGITKPDGQGIEFKWQFTWEGIEAL